MEDWQIVKEDAPQLAVAAALIAVPGLAVAASGWADGLGLVVWVSVLGLLVGYALAISHLPDMLAVVFSTLYGYFFVWIGVSRVAILEGSFRERLIEVILRVSDWMLAVVNSGANQDNLVFLFLVAFLAWFLAYNAAWNLFGLRRLWQAIIPPGVGLLVVLYYYSGERSLIPLLGVYLVLTFILANLTNLRDRELFWQYNRINYEPAVRGAMLRAGLASVALLVALAWFVPVREGDDQLAALLESENSPWVQVEEAWQRLFGGVETEVVTTPVYYGGQSLSLGGPVNLSDQTALYVFAPQGYRYYWRSKVFDTYENGGWSTQIEGRVSDRLGQLPPEEPASYALRRPIQQNVELVLAPTQLLYAAGQPQSFDSIPVRADVTFNEEGVEYATVNAVRLDEGVFQPGDRYGVVSSISYADAGALRGAGTDYPAWITDRYLQVPESVTERTRALAESLGSRVDTPYDLAAGVEAYLRATIQYNEFIAAPPPGAEPVDYVLFESREGYCTYYASAMTILLRLNGVPARMAAGFSQGEYDLTLRGYRVAESDAHTWVEVYFPGYGWVEFEPTAARGVTERDAENGFSPVPEPLVEPTPETQGINPDAEGDVPQPGQPESDDLASGPEDDKTRPGLGGNADEAGAGAAGFSFSIPPFVRWLAVLLLAVGVAAGGVWYWLEGRGTLAVSETARSYIRMMTYAGLLGIKPGPGDTPDERADQIEVVVPEASRHIREITRLHTREQYAPPRADQADIERDQQASAASWRRARPAFVRVWLSRLGRRG